MKLNLSKATCIDTTPRNLKTICTNIDNYFVVKLVAKSVLSPFVNFQ